MIVGNRQNVLPITYGVFGQSINMMKSKGQLGDALTDGIGSVVSSLVKLFTGTPHPWINAQNQTESNIAAIVANYVAVKNAGGLTAAYINTAISQVQAQATGFSQFITQYSGTGGSEYSAAQKGAGDITSNANAVIANMRMDLAKLPVTPVSSILPGILNPAPVQTITNPDGTVTVLQPAPGIASSLTSNPLLLGAAAFFLLPKLFK